MKEIYRIPPIQEPCIDGSDKNVSVALDTKGPRLLTYLNVAFPYRDMSATSEAPQFSGGYDLNVAPSEEPGQTLIDLYVFPNHTPSTAEIFYKRNSSFLLRYQLSEKLARIMPVANAIFNCDDSDEISLLRGGEPVFKAVDNHGRLEWAFNDEVTPPNPFRDSSVALYNGFVSTFRTNDQHVMFEYASETPLATHKGVDIYAICGLRYKRGAMERLPKLISSGKYSDAQFRQEIAPYVLLQTHSLASHRPFQTPI